LGLTHLRIISQTIENDQATIIDMSDNADPVIGWVLGELRKAANEGESMTFWSIP